MGAIYSLIPSGYVAPTNTTTLDKLVAMPLDEQANYASQSLIMHAGESEIAKKLLDAPMPESMTVEYVASLAAVIKAGGEHTEALRVKYDSAIKLLEPSNDEKKDSAEMGSPVTVTAEPPVTVTSEPSLQVEQKEATTVRIIEKYVPVEYCPKCNTIYGHYGEDESESDSTTDSVD